jgi:hypothetical protein
LRVACVLCAVAACLESGVCVVCCGSTSVTERYFF